MALKKIQEQDGVSIYQVPFKILAQGTDDLHINTCTVTTEGKYIFLFNMDMKQKRVAVIDVPIPLNALNDIFSEKESFELDKKYENNLILAIAPKCHEEGVDFFEESYIFQKNRAMIVVFPDLPKSILGAIASCKYKIKATLLSVNISDERRFWFE